MQKNLPFINSAHGSDTRNIINELIRLFNAMGYTYRQSLKRALDVLEEAQRINDSNEDVQQQIDNIIKGVADPNAEIAQARGTYPLLKDRFNANEGGLNRPNDRLNSMRINAMYPPAPLVGVVPDANYYDDANFKYYKDETFLEPATDNKGALQGIVNYLENKGGGTIEMPAGKFVFRSEVKWKSKVSLVGASKISTQLFAEGEWNNLIGGREGAANGSDYNDESVWYEDCTFSDFLIDNKGLSYPDATVNGKALFILYMRRPVFKDLILLNTLGTALGCDFLEDFVIDRVFTDRAGRSSYPTGHGGNSGIGIGTSALAEEPGVVSNCFAYNSGNYGFFVETQKNPEGTQAKYAKFVNCHAMNNRLGFGNKGSGGTQFIGCTAYKNRIHGFHFTQDSSGDQLSGCISEFNGGDGIRIEGDYKGNINISNIIADNNSGSGIRQFTNVFTLNNMRISTVQAHKNGSCGVWVGGNTKNVKLIDIDAVNNGKDTNLLNSYRRGIKVQLKNDIVSILSNTVFDDQSTKTQLVGIEVSSNTTNYLLDGNNVVGYDDATAYSISSSEGTIGINGGMSGSEAKGIATFSDGQLAIYINHFLGSPATAVTLTPMGNNRVWLKDNHESNRVRIERDDAAGTLEVMYDIS